MELKVGDKVPNFVAIDTNGATFDSQNTIGKKPVVLYFYPKDNTPGCTAQACSFRDQYEDFIDLGAEVIGVSSDSVAAHQKFTKQYKLPFILLSDSNKKIRNLFGVPSGMFPDIQSPSVVLMKQLVCGAEPSVARFMSFIRVTVPSGAT